LSKRDGELTPYVEVQMEMLESSVGMVDIVKQMCTDLECELLSFLPILKETRSEQQETIAANDLNIVELFKKFYKEKYPESDSAPDYLESHFKELLDKSSDEDS
ncbi:MAG: hypothetical protein KC478_14355, partial [Bacteriovoracaceae bacterium]|nr:hypothetical protein [Bacteriovoracaceae bacterium]